MVAVELSDSTAIIILASIAGVYFSITAACSVVICRILCKKQCTTSSLPPKFPSSAPGKNQYELTDLRGTVRGIRDSSDLVPGGRAGRWRQYVSSSQPLSGNGTSQQHNGSHTNGYTQERPKLPAIEEVGAGGEEEEEEEGGEATAVAQTEDTTARDSAIRSQWRAKRKVRGRTSSTKFLLEETDGSSWTLTSTNGINVMEDVMSSLTASLPGPVLSQCDQSHPQPAVPVPRPVPGNTRSESPVILQTSSSRTADTGTSLGHGPRAESDHPAKESPSNTRQRVRRTQKQLSLSTHSLPRHSTASTTRTLETQVSVGSGTLPPANESLTSGGSRPRLRRYASTASYSSTPSLDPVILVRPRSRAGSRRGSYCNSSTLGRTSFEQEQYCSTTGVEMEGNYYTLQMRRGGGGRETGGAGREEGSSGWTLPTKECVDVVTSSKEDKLDNGDIPEHCRLIRIRDNHLPTAIDLGYDDGQDSTVV